MTSHLTLSALVFSIVSTAALVWTAQAEATPAPQAKVRYVQLERVTITAPRLVAKI